MGTRGLQAEKAMDRRAFLSGSLAGAATIAGGAWASQPRLQRETSFGPTWSVIPVVGDGKWIWTEPPKDQTGYLEPRSFELSIGVEMTGEGDATDVKASTPVPIEHPEQKVDDVKLETDGCEARLQQIGEGAAQLLVAADQIAGGQKIRALARYQLTLTKQYFGYAQDKFPSEQPAAPAAIRKLYLQDSPGIQSNSALVKKLLGQLRGQEKKLHPWQLALRAQTWINENIRRQPGPFIGVINALERKMGDCEEMAGIIVALCRLSQIPARLVWVPNHNWSEIYLTDHDGQGHWVPVHTGCYQWLGWTGAHELVIQKGDRVTPPHETRPQRLLGDWRQWSGKKPTARFIAELKPLPPKTAAGESGTSLSDAGPGARTKDAMTGEWKLAGTHPANRHMRQG
jgi:hypothetical protein